MDQRRSCTGIRLQGFLDEMKDSVKDVTQLTRFDENAQREFWDKAILTNISRSISKILSVYIFSSYMPPVIIE